MQRWQGRIASATTGTWYNFSPMLSRKSLAIALNAPKTLRQGGLMPRLLLERLNKPLANIPMVDGAPATPVRWKNCYQHLPRVQHQATYYSKAVQRRWLRTPKPTRQLPASAPPTVLSRFLDPENMLTAPLYNPDALMNAATLFREGRLSKAHAGRLITLEQTAQLLNRLKIGTSSDRIND